MLSHFLIKRPVRCLCRIQAFKTHRAFCFRHLPINEGRKGGILLKPDHGQDLGFLVVKNVTLLVERLRCQMLSSKVHLRHYACKPRAPRDPSLYSPLIFHVRPNSNTSRFWNSHTKFYLQTCLLNLHLSG